LAQRELEHRNSDKLQAVGNIHARRASPNVRIWQTGFLSENGSVRPPEDSHHHIPDHIPDHIPE
jgi:hypothetical protein